jgi:hypothetical protein
MREKREREIRKEDDMSFDIISMTRAMTEAASRSVLCWPAIRVVAQCELRRFAEMLEDVRRLYANGVIEEDEAFGIASVHRNSVQTALREIQNVNEMAMRAAAARVIKAAVKEVRHQVNQTMGFPLI